MTIDSRNLFLMLYRKLFPNGLRRGHQSSELRVVGSKDMNIAEQVPSSFHHFLHSIVALSF